MNAIDQAIRAAIGLAGLAALGACTSLPVTTDTNPNASVSVCHTYAFAQEHSIGTAQPGGAYSNPVNSDRLRAVIAANLASRGFQPALEHGSADCVVGYAIGSRVVADEFAGFGVGWGWGRRGFGGVGYDWPPVRNEGRIAIDLFDAHNRQAIWHASVNQDVTDLTGPHAEVRINDAANAIFTKFPVPAGAPPPSSAPSAT
jgi:uncharacterized protein DUF4136